MYCDEHMAFSNSPMIFHTVRKKIEFVSWNFWDRILCVVIDNLPESSG